VTLLTVISGLVVATVAPEAKLEPARVIGNEAPDKPLDGVMEERIGGPGKTAKGTGDVVPPDVVTVMLALPVAALPAILKIAVI
jgi:hypothetical protein